MFKLNEFNYQIDEFLNYCNFKNFSKKTMRSYELTLRLFSNYVKDNYNIHDAVNVKEVVMFAVQDIIKCSYMGIVNNDKGYGTIVENTYLIGPVAYPNWNY